MPPPVRRLLAALMAAGAFCAFGSSTISIRTADYYQLIAIVFTPAALVWLNASPSKVSRIAEGLGWTLLVVMVFIGIMNL